MSKRVTLVINGKAVQAEPGATLLDAALGGNIVLPQDCCTGQCETCRVDVVSGACDPVGTQEQGTVLACQARVTQDCEIHFDPVPIVMKTGGEIKAIRDLGGEIVEVVIRTTRSVPYLPGQYVKVAFGAFPERDYSPSLTMEGLREHDEIVLHIRRMADGVVSAALGNTIRVGGRVKVRGPYGNAYLRRGSGRLVLISTGTGFSPLWSIAVAARLGQPKRPVVVIASARDPRNLYMRPAMEWLVQHGAEAAILAASGASPLPPARFGRASDFLPELEAEDTVYAAGEPNMIETVRHVALSAGAKFYADPFLPSNNKPSFKMRVAEIFTRRVKPKSPVHAQIDTLTDTLNKS